MKKSLILPSLLALALVGCKSSSKSVVTQPTAQQTSVASLLTPPPSPKYGWKQFHAETFETYPVHSADSNREFVIPKGSSRLKVMVDASSAILGGVLPDEVFLALRFPHKNLRNSDFKNMPCFLDLVDKTSVTCDIDRSKKMAFVVRDGRAEVTEAAGAFGFLHHSKKLAEHAVLPNKIHISFSTWQCIENCKNK